jgi:hypothetical protein
VVVVDFCGGFAGMCTQNASHVLDQAFFDAMGVARNDDHPSAPPKYPLEATDHEPCNPPAKVVDLVVDGSKLPNDEQRTCAREANGEV